MSDLETPNLPQGAARPVIAIVGRPNVGKSTLFNRIVGGRRALVQDVPGVTRDRNYGDGAWNGRPFTIVDTGGFLPQTEDKLLRQVRDQARLAVEEAQVVILVTDGMAGLTAVDQEIAAMLRRSGKPVFVAVNKIDSAKREQEGFLADFWALGLEAVFPTSAEHSRGVGELMDALVASLPEAPLPEPVDEELCRVAIVGRPNVGKSTLINRLLGEERFVASEVPGTTTDSVDTRLTYKGRTFVLTDTAGIRRKRAIAARVEQFSVMRAFRSIDRADVVILLLDATEPAVDQDAKIAALALEKGKAMVVMVNKWDLLPDAKAAAFRDELKRSMPFVSWAPIVFGSALTGDHVFQALERAGQVFEHYSARLPTPQLNEFLQAVVDEHPAPLYGGHPVRLFYIAQTGSRPPVFSVTCNKPEGVTDDYKRFIVNRMRESFGLKVPVRLIAKRKSKRAFVAKKR